MDIGSWLFREGYRGYKVKREIGIGFTLKIVYR